MTLSIHMVSSSTFNESSSFTFYVNIQRKTEFAQLFQGVVLASAASFVQMTKIVLESRSVVQMDVDTPA